MRSHIDKLSPTIKAEYVDGPMLNYQYEAFLNDDELNSLNKLFKERVLGQYRLNIHDIESLAKIAKCGYERANKLTEEYAAEIKSLKKLKKSLSKPKASFLKITIDSETGTEHTAIKNDKLVLKLSQALTLGLEELPSTIYVNKEINIKTAVARFVKKVMERYSIGVKAQREIYLIVGAILATVKFLDSEEKFISNSKGKGKSNIYKNYSEFLISRVKAIFKNAVIKKEAFRKA